MEIVRAASEKPGRVATTRYVPVASTSTSYLPSALVWVAISRPVAISRMTMRAPGTPAPAGSETNPVMVAAIAGLAHSRTARTLTNTRRHIHKPPHANLRRPARLGAVTLTDN